MGQEPGLVPCPACELGSVLNQSGVETERILAQGEERGGSDAQAS